MVIARETFENSGLQGTASAFPLSRAHKEGTKSHELMFTADKYLGEVATHLQDLHVMLSQVSIEELIDPEAEHVSFASGMILQKMKTTLQKLRSPFLTVSSHIKMGVLGDEKIDSIFIEENFQDSVQTLSELLKEVCQDETRQTITALKENLSRTVKIHALTMHIQALIAPLAKEKRLAFETNAALGMMSLAFPNLDYLQ